MDAVDPDKHIARAKQDNGLDSANDEPTQEQVEAARTALVADACKVFDAPEFRELICDIKKKSEQVIDAVSIDEVIFAGYDQKAKNRAKEVVGSFKRFMADNKDDLTALQMFYSKPYRERHLTYTAIRELSEALSRPPYNLAPEIIWKAYEQLDEGKVKRLGVHKILTNIVS